MPGVRGGVVQRRGRGTEEGTLGIYPERGYKKTLARPGAKSR